MPSVRALSDLSGRRSPPVARPRSSQSGLRDFPLVEPPWEPWRLPTSGRPSLHPALLRLSARLIDTDPSGKSSRRKLPASKRALATGAPPLMTTRTAFASPSAEGLGDGAWAGATPAHNSPRVSHAAELPLSEDAGQSSRVDQLQRAEALPELPPPVLDASVESAEDTSSTSGVASAPVRDAAVTDSADCAGLAAAETSQAAVHLACD